MPLVVPDIAEVDALQKILTPNLTLKLYGNNVTPGPGDTAATYTEIAGGGYTSKPLVFANWTFVPNNPSYGLYAQQEWIFTGPVNAPGTVYGYFVVRDLDGKLEWAQRFPAAVLPYSPIAGSIIKITPKFTGSSVF